MEISHLDKSLGSLVMKGSRQYNNCWEEMKLREASFYTFNMEESGAY